MFKIVSAESRSCQSRPRLRRPSNSSSSKATCSVAIGRWGRKKKELPRSHPSLINRQENSISVPAPHRKAKPLISVCIRDRNLRHPPPANRDGVVRPQNRSGYRAARISLSPTSARRSEEHTSELQSPMYL